MRSVPILLSGASELQGSTVQRQRAAKLQPAAVEFFRVSPQMPGYLLQYVFFRSNFILEKSQPYFICELADVLPELE